MTSAIVHEWVAQAGGSEKVFDEFAKMYPEAELFVLWDDRKGTYPRTRLNESWIAQTFLRRSKVAALPFMLPTWRRLWTDNRLDWILVSSHLFAHHARFMGINSDIPKLVYAHTPARYIWEPTVDSRGNRLSARAASRVLRPIDRHRANEAASIAANSQFTRERIERTWEREACVIHPPVNVKMIQKGGPWADRVIGPEREALARLPETYILGASRLVQYKRLEAAILAGEASDIPVVLAGSGPDEARLKAIAAKASVPVTFIPTPTDAMLWALYEKAMVYVFAAVEDFGIMPVEAMALGTPVLAAGRGGTAESVVEGVTGAYIPETEGASLRDALVRASMCDPTIIRQHAQSFDRSVFERRIREWISGEVDVLRENEGMPCHDC